MDGKQLINLKLIQDIKKEQERLNKAREKFQKNYTQVGSIDTGKTFTDPETKERKQIVVPIYRYVGWSAYDPQNKYNNHKLREIRANQTAKAIKGHTHYRGGAPIILDRLVDLKAA